MTQSADETSFACALPPSELRARRAEVLASVRRQALRIDENSDGFTFTFPSSPALRAELEELLRFEAACCSFIRMELVEAESELRLETSAPPGGKRFIAHELFELSPLRSG